MNIQFYRLFTIVVAGLTTMLFFSPVSIAADPWEPEGLEAVWSAGHRSHPEFMNVRRQEYETQIPARTTAEPWMPEGLEAVWSGGHRSHPDFLDVRRKEYENQIPASESGSTDSIVTIYEEGRSTQMAQKHLVSRSQ